MNMYRYIGINLYKYTYVYIYITTSHHKIFYSNCNCFIENLIYSTTLFKI